MSGLLAHAMSVGCKLIPVMLRIRVQESSDFESECAPSHFQLYRITVQDGYYSCKQIFHLRNQIPERLLSDNQANQMSWLTDVCALIKRQFQ